MAETFGTYAEKWLRRRDLKPRSREHYRSILNRHIPPTFGDVPLKAVTSEVVRDWYADLEPDHPTLRAHAYSLLRTIFSTAVTDEKLTSSPCHIRGAGTTRRARKIQPATLSELEVITASLPVKYRPLLMLCAWCALRFGEATELRRKDIDLTNGVIHVRRGVVRAEGQTMVGSPKSEASVRDVAIPPHLMPMLKAHVTAMPMRGKDALLFPATDGVSHIAPSTLYRVFYPARKAAGRPDLRWHDLRAYRGNVGRTDRCDAGRAHGPSRSLNAAGRSALSARRTRPRRRDCRRVVTDRPSHQVSSRRRPPAQDLRRGDIRTQSDAALELPAGPSAARPLRSRQTRVLFAACRARLLPWGTWADAKLAIHGDDERVMVGETLSLRFCGDAVRGLHIPPHRNSYVVDRPIPRHCAAQ